jgi:hypothetical protein
LTRSGVLPISAECVSKEAQLQGIDLKAARMLALCITGAARRAPAASPLRDPASLELNACRLTP